jgi:hypothetical protein
LKDKDKKLVVKNTQLEKEQLNNLSKMGKRHLPARNDIYKIKITKCLK